MIFVSALCSPFPWFSAQALSRPWELIGHLLILFGLGACDPRFKAGGPKDDEKVGFGLKAGGHIPVHLIHCQEEPKKIMARLAKVEVVDGNFL